MSEIKNITNEAELENAAGGYVTPDAVHNLNNFVYRTVVNLPAGTFLQMQSSPNGGFLSPMYSNGQAIFVNSFFSEGGYLLAFRDGIYGFVDAKYVM